MDARKLAAVPAVIAMVAATPALADTTTGKTVTATGTGQVKVKPKDRQNNASIAAAEKAAQKAAIPLAIKDAKADALLYAAAAGLTLGSVLSVSDAVNNGPFYGPPSFAQGPFGPGKYCGTRRILVTKILPGGPRPKHLKFKKVHRCEVPSPATATLTVTYSAT